MVEKAPVTGISAASGCSIYSVRGIENSGDLQVKLFELLSENDISVDMITQQMEKDGTRSISFSLTAEQEADFEKALSSSDIFKDVKVSKQENMAIVSVIGVGMASYSGVAGKVFSVLAQEQINFPLGKIRGKAEASSGLSITVSHISAIRGGRKGPESQSRSIGRSV